MSSKYLSANLLYSIVMVQKSMYGIVAILAALFLWAVTMGGHDVKADESNGHMHTDCDFGYHWNDALQQCTPILNPNSSSQQPHIVQVDSGVSLR
jgi:hypothetical protein